MGRVYLFSVFAIVVVLFVTLGSLESATLAVQQQQNQDMQNGTAATGVGDLTTTTRKTLEQILEKDRNKEVNLLAVTLESKLDKAAAILEATSKLPEVKNLPYANMLSKTLKTIHGIPQDADIVKRELAQAILSKYKDFLSIALLMPNGDVYMIEPYARQLNLTTPNLSFRDYFKGAVNTGQTYVSDVIISKASGRSVITMATPVYLGNNSQSPRTPSSSLAGVLYGVLNFDIYNGLLQSIANSTTADNSSSRILILDKNGIKIADSDVTQLSSLSNKTKDVPFSHLEGFKNAIAGKSGSVVEVVNGTKMIVSYHPVKAIQTTWVVLSMMRPYG